SVYRCPKEGILSQMADITREDALALLAEQDINEIVQDATKASSALATFRTVRMSAKVARMPVLSALPTAGFVSESATDAEGVKPTTKVEWARKELIAEEIVCIVPIHSSEERRVGNEWGCRRVS